MVSTPIVAAISGAVVAGVFGVFVGILRYVFDVSFVTSEDVADQIADKQIGNEEIDRIVDTLERHGDQLHELEDLIMGGEYRISDGMLELVEVNADNIEEGESRITGVERVQLKIRRRQRSHEGGDDVAPEVDENDVDPDQVKTEAPLDDESSGQDIRDEPAVDRDRTDFSDFEHGSNLDDSDDGGADE